MLFLYSCSTNLYSICILVYFISIQVMKHKVLKVFADKLYFSSHLRPETHKMGHFRNWKTVIMDKKIYDLLSLMSQINGGKSQFLSQANWFFCPFMYLQLFVCPLFVPLLQPFGKARQGWCVTDLNSILSNSKILRKWTLHKFYWISRFYNLFV